MDLQKYNVHNFLQMAENNNMQYHRFRHSIKDLKAAITEIHVSRIRINATSKQFNIPTD